MKIKFPLVSRKKYEKLEDRAQTLRTHLETQRASYQKQLDVEYTRALREGKGQLHRMAVDMTYEVFMGQTIQWRAFLQQLEGMFKPVHTDLPTISGDEYE